ncbi:MAG: DUF1800 domain-containing protein [bacterium]|nr:DUF1800 domain-containing protein [bacterium]
MVNEGATLGAAAARHLLRRTGFGALARDVSRYTGLSRGAAADRLVGFKAKAFKPGGSYFEQAHDKWVTYILKAKFPLMEKLALFWHDHFAVAIAKVIDVKRMGLYVGLLHQHCNGNLKTFVKAMNKDAAMMEFLDTVRNDKGIPNENYARELQELFTLGVYDLAGQPNYTQADIVQIARAFTGWTYDGSNKPRFDDYRHDYAAEFPERGPKTLFAGRPGFPAGGASFASPEGATEIDQVVDVLFQHTDSQGKNTVARRTAYRLCEYFAHPQPSLAFVDQIVAHSGFDVSFDIRRLVRSLLCHDEFYASAAGPPYTEASRKSVRWPIDYVVGTLRILGLKPRGRYQVIQGGSYRRVFDHLGNMGQTLMDPPSVFGWDWETSWVSSSTLLARYNFARDIIMARWGGGALKTDRLVNTGLTDPGAIVDAVTDLFGVRDQLSPAERQVFVDYLTENGTVPSIDLRNWDVRNTKLNGLFALVMQSPAYQLH